MFSSENWRCVNSWEKDGKNPRRRGSAAAPSNGFVLFNERGSAKQVFCKFHRKISDENDSKLKEVVAILESTFHHLVDGHNQLCEILPSLSVYWGAESRVCLKRGQYVNPCRNRDKYNHCSVDKNKRLRGRYRVIKLHSLQNQ